MPFSPIYHWQSLCAAVMSLHNWLGFITAHI